MMSLFEKPEWHYRNPAFADHLESLILPEKGHAIEGVVALGDWPFGTTVAVVTVKGLGLCWLADEDKTVFHFTEQKAEKAGDKLRKKPGLSKQEHARLYMYDQIRVAFRNAQRCRPAMFCTYTV